MPKSAELEVEAASSPKIEANRSEAGNVAADASPQRTIAAGEFKAKCLKLLDEVAETREPMTITKFGKPVARIVPIEADRQQLRGAMRGTVLWEGDIISPLGGDAWAGLPSHE